MSSAVLQGFHHTISSLSGGKRFSKVDLSHAYQQLKLDNESHQFVWVTVTASCTRLQQCQVRSSLYLQALSLTMAWLFTSANLVISHLSWRTMQSLILWLTQIIQYSMLHNTVNTVLAEKSQTVDCDDDDIYQSLYKQFDQWLLGS